MFLNWLIPQYFSEIHHVPDNFVEIPDLIQNHFKASWFKFRGNPFNFWHFSRNIGVGDGLVLYDDERSGNPIAYVPWENI